MFEVVSAPASRPWQKKLQESGATWCNPNPLDLFAGLFWGSKLNKIQIERDLLGRSIADNVLAPPNAPIFAISTNDLSLPTKKPKLRCEQHICRPVPVTSGIWSTKSLYLQFLDLARTLDLHCTPSFTHVADVITVPPRLVLSASVQISKKQNSESKPSRKASNPRVCMTPQTLFLSSVCPHIKGSSMQM